MKCMGFLFEHIKNNEFRLSENLKPNGWGHISKIEEENALDVIKRKWVPKAAEMWNKKHYRHKVDVNNILKGLKKVRQDSVSVPDDVVKYNRSDVIHYQYDVPNTRYSMTFMIHRFSNPTPYRGGFPDRSLMAGFFSGTALFEEPV